MQEGQTASTKTNGRDLRPYSGMSAAVEERTLTLHFGPEVIPAAPETRTSADLRPVLFSPQAARDDDPLYTIYRGVAPQESAEEIERRGLRYVAVVMRAGTIGPEERARTRGHINSSAAHTSAHYPDIYEVWQGRALLYLQNEAAPEVGDTVYLTLDPGDKMVVAPGWASLLVNIGDSPLAVGLWRGADVAPQYEALTALGGMAHFVLADNRRESGFHFEPNTRYRSVAIPRRLTAHDISDFGLKHDESMLTTFRRNPDFLRFMTRPQDYDHVWSRLYREE